MRPLIQEIQTAHTPESLVGQLRGEGGIVLLRSSSFDSPQARYSFVVARPFLAFRSFGSRCEISNSQLPSPVSQIQFGNPWQILDALMARYELLDEIDLPFPLGGAFGYWKISPNPNYRAAPRTIWNCPTVMSVSTTASPSSIIASAKFASSPPA